MVKTVTLSRPEEKWARLDQFDPRTQTWLVSDITSKIQVQRRLLAKFGQIEDGAVLRASEFWRRLVWTHFPEWRTVSMDLVKTLIQRELESEKISWAQGPGAGHALAGQMAQLLPLIVHDRSGELMAEWFEQHPESVLRWGHWYHLARHIWKRLEYEKMIPPAWLPAFLLSSDLTQWQWSRSVVVDLSAQMTSLEMELFDRSNLAVEILQPRPIWSAAFRDDLAVYERKTKSAASTARTEDLHLRKSFRMPHFTSPLAEVKDAVASVRQWLEDGVGADRIALAAPDMEMYWPLLAPALEEEGIPVDRVRTVPVHGLPSVQLWLARLRLALGTFQNVDLELATFSEGTQVMSYDKFKQLFTNFYSTEQALQLEWYQKRFRQELHASEILGRDEFVSRVASYWGSEDTEPLERIIKQLLEDAPPLARFSARHWFDWLEAWVGKIETELTLPSPGIHCVNISSAEWLGLEKIYVLGLNEEALRKFSPYGLSRPEADTLERDLGVVVGATEAGSLEFELRWLLDQPGISGVLSCPKSDPEGTPLTPSRLWLVQADDPKRALKSHAFPLATRWDDIQKAQLKDIAQLRHWSDQQAELLTLAMKEDLGELNLKPFGQNLRPRLSASQMENYAKCPFTFAAGKLFHLNDWPAVDLDLDHFSRGKLLHAVFERLTAEPIRYDWSLQDLERLVDEAANDIEIVDLGLWAQLRGRFIETATKFLQFESNWRKEFPGTKTVARELKFSAAWSTSLGKLVPEADMRAGDFPFSGVIDRVDSADGEYVLLDYKSSTAGLAGAESWSRNSTYQLALYAAAVEEGLTSLPKGLVRGAFYFDARDFARNTGLQVNGASALLPPTGKRNTAMEQGKRDQLLAKLFAQMNDHVKMMVEGKFSPQPQDRKICVTCEWRTLCRAPHLH